MKTGLSAPFSLLALAVLLSGCGYVGTFVKQKYYTAQLSQAPRQRVYKHLLDRDTFFVFGQVPAASSRADARLAVIAVSDTPTPGEIVDVSQFVRGESYFGLNLPAGDYRLLLASDADGDGFYTAAEVSLQRAVRVDTATAPDKVLPNCDFPASGPPPAAVPAFRIAVTPVPNAPDSVFYPKGSIRSLDDPIFSPQMSTLGLYEPAAFMEAAPMMFYALEEDLGYKVPVIFVHGIGGSAREFADIVARLDRRRYRPWFFHYPSGGSLSQLSAMFYEIFLSGNTVPHQQMPLVIVAHSMGGLVVRDALNRLRGTARESAVGCLVTLASPLGGHPAARRAALAPVVIPSWRDLQPESDFVRQLHRRPLPSGLKYHLFYAFANDRTVKLGDNSDGVVPLESQLDPPAQKEAHDQHGFNTTHTGILRDPAAIALVLQAIGEIKSNLPDDHLRECDKGGYDLPLGPEFSPMEAYLVRAIGHYMDAMAAGTIKPIAPEQADFVEECAGRRRPSTPAATAWLKLARLFPNRPRT